MQCPQLKSPVNGALQFSVSSNSIKAVYQCNKSYKLLGPNIRVCQGQQWSGTDSQCLRGNSSYYLSVFNYIHPTFKHTKAQRLLEVIV